jgi:hypothetical protein
MTWHSLSYSVAACFLVLAIGAGASADTVFLDDFSDGSVTNGIPLASNTTPVKWTDRGNGNYDASSGDYVFTPPQPQIEQYMSADALDFQLADVSIRVQGRITGGTDSALILTARNQVAEDTRHYVGGIGYFPGLGGTVLFIGKNNPGVSFTQFGGNPVMPFDIRQQDAVVQLDVIGNKLSLWAWRAGDAPPAIPQLTATDNQYTTVGFVRIVGGSGTHRDSTTIYRFVHVSNTHIPIPEPTTALLVVVAPTGAMTFVRIRGVR